MHLNYNETSTVITDGLQVLHILCFGSSLFINQQHNTPLITHSQLTIILYHTRQPLTVLTEHTVLTLRSSNLYTSATPCIIRPDNLPLHYYVSRLIYTL